MKIDVSKFGDILVSRPAGREAFQIIISYLSPADESEPVELDFSKVKVMTPSWLEEVLTGLRGKYGDRLICMPTANLSVVESLKVIGK